MKTVNRRVLGLGGALLALFVFGAWQSGPGITGGKNPLRTFVATHVFQGIMSPTGSTVPITSTQFKQQIFEVPQGQVFVLDDFRVMGPAPTINSNGSKVLTCTVTASLAWLVNSGGATVAKANSVPKNVKFSSGEKLSFVLMSAASYSKINCPNGLITSVVVTGHLMKQ